MLSAYFFEKNQSVFMKKAKKSIMICQLSAMKGRLASGLHHPDCVPWLNIGESNETTKRLYLD